MYIITKILIKKQIGLPDNQSYCALEDWKLQDLYFENVVEDGYLSLFTVLLAQRADLTSLDRI